MILNIGRFGPYLKYKDKFIAVPKKFNPLNLSRAQAIEIIDNKMLKDQKKALLDNQ
ncbi:MAG: topoisomerase C-terminal repeat-containing protein [Rickettsiaceae bacterium]